MSRDVYADKLKAQIDEWNATIAAWEAKSKQAEADAKIKYEQYLNDVREKRDVAQSKLNEIQSSTDRAWEDVKSGVDKAFADLKSSLERAASNLQ